MNVETLFEKMTAKIYETAAYSAAYKLLVKLNLNPICVLQNLPVLQTKILLYES